MSNVIHNYPKSSCDCYRCNEKNFTIPEGVPTNMSVAGCSVPDYYGCYSTRVFKVQQEPVARTGTFTLNPGVLSKDKFDPNFNAIDSKTCPRSSCSGTTYLSSDPRLFNAASGDWMQLDRPPLVSTPKLNTLKSDKKLNCYGQGYKSYNDVNAGQISYYINRELEDAFFEPLFTKKATAVGTMYQDPMGVMRPQYERFPNEKFDPVLENACDAKGDSCLSWIRDSQHHREDLLASQMRKHNEQRFAPRWTNVSQP